MGGSTLKDITGKRYGRLTVLSRDQTTKKIVYWHCICDCGTPRRVRGGNLQSGHVASCGCLYREARQCRRTHGLSGTIEYKAWAKAKGRCYTPTDSKYKNYGARGIKMCARWLHSFEKFLSDMGPRPAKHSLERKNVNGDYKPSNCCWALPIVQGNNTTRNVRVILANGQRYTLSQAARALNVKRYRVAKWHRDHGLRYFRKLNPVT